MVINRATYACVHRGSPILFQTVDIHLMPADQARIMDYPIYKLMRDQMASFNTKELKLFDEIIKQLAGIFL